MFVISYSKAEDAWLLQVSRCHMIHQMLNAHSNTSHLHTAVAHSSHFPCNEEWWRTRQPAVAPTPSVNTLPDRCFVILIIYYFHCVSNTVYQKMMRFSLTWEGVLSWSNSCPSKELLNHLFLPNQQMRRITWITQVKDTHCNSYWWEAPPAMGRFSQILCFLKCPHTHTYQWHQWHHSKQDCTSLEL